MPGIEPALCWLRDLRLYRSLHEEVSGNVSNFTTHWSDGRKLCELVNSVAPGLCPDWQEKDPNEGIENTQEGMDLAEKWLDVTKLHTPEEFVDPKLDEASRLTYLSQFANAKLKPGAPIGKEAANKRRSRRATARKVDD